MTDPKHFYSTVTEQLIQRVSRAYLSHLSPTSHTLRCMLTECLSRPPGQPDGLLADPVFEGMWSWQQAAPTMAELAGNLLHPALVDALDRAPQDTRFGADWHPFAHQHRAWELLRGEPRSLVVSSGTGSGKTECFLVPILDHLVRQAQAKAPPLVGVRALFLYPLNALIASQRERLSSWLAPFRGQLRYALYNGDTPERAPNHRGPIHEVDNRVDLRRSPPPILVTNSTMLEYMLVRNDDAPLLEQSRGCLEWIVLDEAHTYVGSQAAETALLLRRVMSAFGCSADRVRFIATSATIGDGGEESRAALRSYLASIAGVDPTRVEVVFGQRSKPSLPPVTTLHTSTTADIIRELDAAPPEQHHQICLSSLPVRRVIEKLLEREAQLSELVAAAGDAGVSTTGEPADPAATMLGLLDRVRRVTNADGKALLPLRGHLFQRTIAGLWACIGGGCVDEGGSGDWEFGRLYFARRELCDCGAPVFPVVFCSNCGSEYLAAVGTSLVDMRPRAFDDDDDDDDDGDDSTDDETATSGRSEINHLLICNRAPFENSPLLKYIQSDRHAHVNRDLYYCVSNDGSPLRCTRCGVAEWPNRTNFRPARVGAPFMLGISIPILLENAPKTPHDGLPLPADGRRTITFTDSRQGTAHFALKARGEAERNCVRSLLWASLRPVTPTAADLGRRAELGRERMGLRVELDSGRVSEWTRGIALDRIAAIDRDLDSANTSPFLSWQGARAELLGSQNLARWVFLDWHELVDDPQTLAQFRLFSEFARRPARASSLESLGLVALRYPKLRQLGEHDLPESAQRLNLSLANWIDYLTILLDYLVRANLAVRVTERFGDDCERRYPFDYLRWMGARMRLRAIAPPGHSGSSRNDYLRGWPSSSRSSRMIRLLRLGLGVTEEKQPAGFAAAITDFMQDCWLVLERLGLLVRVRQWAGHREHEVRREEALGILDHGYVMPLDMQAELVAVERAYLCPISRRMLPVAFCGYSPYVDDNATASPEPCKVFEMPRPPSDPRDVPDWLESDPTILELRQRAVWTENSDRIVSGALYFRVVEHSANVDGPRLRERERLFRRGELNLLSCSTTMEMGVDIGGISSVSMNNAPPAPANYLQRAGRAGRRGETAALSLTLCGAVPHGEAVFREPRWPFIVPIRVPRVLLAESTRIVQRHVNAICLRHFLIGMGRGDRMKSTMGWFFGPPLQFGTSEVWRRFVTMLDEPRIETLDDSLTSLVAGSSLSGLGARSLRQAVGAAVERVEQPWTSQREALIFELEQAGGRFESVDRSNLAQLAISRQLRRLLGEYLLSELTARGFLPGHGFPTHVLPFVNTTFEEMDRAQRRRSRGNLGETTDRDDEDPKYPSRDLAVAIREYAPGSAVVVDGRIYESSGVTLNWKVPAGSGDTPTELQSFRYAWSCSACDIQDTSLARPKNCLNCGGKVKSIHYMEPSGFAVKLSYRAHNDLSQRRLVTTTQPWISTASTWQPLHAPAYGRMRSNSSGIIFHHSRGMSRLGYALCLTCGFAASEHEPRSNGRDGRLPHSFEVHGRLRGQRSAGETVCPGAERKAQRYLEFGGQVETDVFELQLRDPTTGQVLDQVLATTLAVALRRSLAEMVGVEDREIGWDTKTCAYPSDVTGHSIVLYDTASGGAGFVLQARERVRDLLVEARKVLACKRDCERACHACLLTYDTQKRIDDIHRRAAESFLSEQFLDGFVLPPSLRLFGHDTRMEYDALHRAIERERSLRGGAELRIHLGGEPEAWEVPEWDLRPMLVNWAAQMPVRLFARASVLSRLPEAASRPLAALLEWRPAISLHERTEPTEPVGLVAELETRDGVVRWAASMALTPGPSPDPNQVRLVAEFQRQRLAPTTERPLDAQTIRPSTPQGLATIDVIEQFDGPLAEFGRRLWDLVLPKAQQLGLKLRSGARIVDITYSDRYVMSPLVARLVVDLVHGFVVQARDNVDEHTRVTVSCVSYPRKGGRRERLTNDWEYASVRDEVVRGLLGNRLADIVGPCHTNAGGRDEVAHARGLFVSFADGTQWKLRLDEGLGFMTTNDGHVFDFLAASASQVETLAGLDVPIYKRYRFASPMFVGQTIG